MIECYVFDIDGTIADCSHRIPHIEKTPKDWDSFFAECHADAPIFHVIGLVTTLFDADQSIVFVSGRSDQCRAATEAWLREHGLPDSPLYMRRAGDHRNDDIVKGELLDQLIADGHKPIMAFDDRDRVVKMWRERGIPCAQVAEGNF